MNNAMMIYNFRCWSLVLCLSLTSLDALASLKGKWRLDEALDPQGISKFTSINIGGQEFTFVYELSASENGMETRQSL